MPAVLSPHASSQRTAHDSSVAPDLRRPAYLVLLRLQECLQAIARAVHHQFRLEGQRELQQIEVAGGPPAKIDLHEGSKVRRPSRRCSRGQTTANIAPIGAAGGAAVRTESEGERRAQEQIRKKLERRRKKAAKKGGLNELQQDACSHERGWAAYVIQAYVIARSMHRHISDSPTELAHLPLWLQYRAVQAVLMVRLRRAGIKRKMPKPKGDGLTSYLHAPLPSHARAARPLPRPRSLHSFDSICSLVFLHAPQATRTCLPMRRAARAPSGLKVGGVRSPAWVRRGMCTAACRHAVQRWSFRCAPPHTARRARVSGVRMARFVAAQAQLLMSSRSPLPQASFFALLETRHLKLLRRAAIHIQKDFRGWLARSKYVYTTRLLIGIVLRVKLWLRQTRTERQLNRARGSTLSAAVQKLKMANALRQTDDSPFMNASHYSPLQPLGAGLAPMETAEGRAAIDRLQARSNGHSHARTRSNGNGHSFHSSQWGRASRSQTDDTPVRRSLSLVEPKRWADEREAELVRALGELSPDAKFTLV